MASLQSRSVVLGTFAILLLQIAGKPIANECDKGKIVIAHRGASGYLPEHTLPAAVMAFGFGSDYVEPDVVMSADDHLVVLHDTHLDTVTDVALKFPPDRKRTDGRYYAVDFTLEEIKSLKAVERFKLEDGNVVYPNRFPAKKSSFQVPSLAEFIELVQGLQKSTGNDKIGIYVEIKEPKFHRSEGKNISEATIEMLKSYGYTSTNDRVYVQCFDEVELLKIHSDIMPQLNVELKLIQLIHTGDYISPNSWLYILNDAAMEKVATYAHGIGPYTDLIVFPNSTLEQLYTSDLVALAHNHKLVVHTYTMRTDDLPRYVKDFNKLLHIFYCQMKVDGVFTDFPDLVRHFLSKQLPCTNLIKK